MASKSPDLVIRCFFSRGDGAPSGTGPGPMPRAGCGPWRGGASGSPAPHASPCAYEIRGFFYAYAYSAGMSASLAYYSSEAMNGGRLAGVGVGSWRASSGVLWDTPRPSYPHLWICLWVTRVLPARLVFIMHTITSAWVRTTRNSRIHPLPLSTGRKDPLSAHCPLVASSAPDDQHYCQHHRRRRPPWHHLCGAYRRPSCRTRTTCDHRAP